MDGQGSTRFTLEQDDLKDLFWTDSMGERKNKKIKEAQFWVLCKCHKIPLSKWHIFCFSGPKWHIPDHITVGVIEAIKQSATATDYQTILLSTAIRDIKQICNKKAQQKQKDQWNQFSPNNSQESKCHRWAEKEISVHQISIWAFKTPEGRQLGEQKPLPFSLVVPKNSNTILWCQIENREHCV